MQRKVKQNHDYYVEIDKALQSHEQYKSWHGKSIEWICNRIDWCWKFRHITQEQMEELVDRICKVMNREV